MATVLDSEDIAIFAESSVGQCYAIFFYNNVEIFFDVRRQNKNNKSVRTISGVKRN